MYIKEIEMKLEQLRLENEQLKSENLKNRRMMNQFQVMDKPAPLMRSYSTELKTEDQEIEKVVMQLNDAAKDPGMFIILMGEEGENAFLKFLI